MIQLTLPIRLGLALAGGVAAGFAFPEPGIAALAPVGVALVTVACWRAPARQALLVGYLSGVAFNLLLLSWLRVVGVDAWLILAVAWSLWWALLGLGTAAVTWWRAWPLGIAGLWVLLEGVRGRVPWGGFPWGRLAFANSDSPLTPWVAIVGAAGVSALAALLGALLVVLVRALVHRHWFATAGTVVLIAVVVCSGLLIPLPTKGQGNPSTVDFAVVQGSVPRVGLDFNAQRRAVLANHVAATVALADEVAASKRPQPEAVVWPENSSDVDPFSDHQAALAIDAAADAIKAPILVGAVVPAGDSTVHNVGIVWDPVLGPTDTYIKQHPVPFGEYLPGRSILSRFITRFERIPSDFSPGDQTGVLQLGPARIGDVICFEIAYDALVRQTVVDGARALVVQTNNATYAGTSQPAQQVAMSRLRAIEHGRTVLIAATSGITAVVAPDGTIVEQLPEQQEGSIDLPAPMRDQLTIADQLDWFPEAALAALGIAGWVVGALTRRRTLGSSS